MMNGNSVGTERLLSEPLNKLIKELALPAIAAQLINLLYSIVDRIYIAGIPETGTAALSALGMATPLVMTVSAFAAFAAYGGAPLASLALGAGNKQRAVKLLESNAVGTFVIAVLLTLLAQLFLPELLYFFGADRSNFVYALEYARIYLMGTIFALPAIALNSFISAQGEARIAMRTVLLGAVANVLLDPLFIFVFKLGTAGAAYATVISQACSVCAVLYFLCSTKAKLALRSLSFDWRLFLQSLSLGVSGFIMVTTESAVIIVYNILLAKHGGAMHLANMVILQSVMQMLFIPMSGYISGVQPLLSYNYGAGNMLRVKSILLKSFKILLSFSAFTALSAVFFPQVYALVFARTEELQALTVRYLPLFIAGMTIFGLQELAQMYFVGSNQVGKSIFLALLRKVVFLIPLSVFLSQIYGLTGIYLSETLADASSASIAACLFYFSLRRSLRCKSGKTGNHAG